MLILIFILAMSCIISAQNDVYQQQTVDPQGVVNGRYAYVDNSGQTISVKYRTGTGNSVKPALRSPGYVPQYEQGQDEQVEYQPQYIRQSVRQPSNRYSPEYTQQYLDQQSIRYTPQYSQQAIEQQSAQYQPEYTQQVTKPRYSIQLTRPQYRRPVQLTYQLPEREEQQTNEFQIPPQSQPRIPQQPEVYQQPRQFTEILFIKADRPTPAASLGQQREYEKYLREETQKAARQQTQDNGNSIFSQNSVLGPDPESVLQFSQLRPTPISAKLASTAPQVFPSAVPTVRQPQRPLRVIYSQPEISQSQKSIPVRPPLFSSEIQPTPGVTYIRQTETEQEVASPLEVQQRLSQTTRSQLTKNVPSSVSHISVSNPNAGFNYELKY